MPKLKFEKKEIIELFESVKEQSKNFSRFDPHLLTENSQHIIIYRLALSMTQREFGRFLGKTSSLISCYEQRKTSISEDNAKNYVSIIQSVLKNTPSLEDVVSNFERFLSDSQGNDKHLNPFKFRKNSERTIALSRKGLKIRRKKYSSSFWKQKTKEVKERMGDDFFTKIGEIGARKR